MSSSFGRRSTGVSRRDLLIQAPFAAAAVAACQGLVLTQASSEAFVEVKTTRGRIRGARSAGLATFRGVPYAGSVAGANRFKAAPPVPAWTGVRDALQLAPPAPQPGRPASPREPAPAEDCLFLNVWTPAADGRKRPVMFYSHGGGFTTGSGGSAYQDGGNLARTADVVVVASNHRLGLMGYLSLPELGGEEYGTSGNQGMLDIRDALKWVHDNIEAFGGDPGNVMIFGESGGGAKTSCLYAMPSAAPYFTKASIESGPGIRMLPSDAAAETTLMLLKHLELDKSSWRKLLELPVEALVAAQVALGQQPGAGPLTMRGGRMGMSGNRRPGGFGIGSVTIAERKYAQRGAPVYMYIFTHGSDRIIPGTTHKLGAAHAQEIRYKFNLVESDGTMGGSDMMAISGPDSAKTARNMSELWSTFARTGRPAAQGQPAWPAYTIERRATMEIDAHCRVVDDPYAAERTMWERLEPSTA
jgi:carboxylesterase type B